MAILHEYFVAEDADRKRLPTYKINRFWSKKCVVPTLSVGNHPAINHLINGVMNLQAPGLNELSVLVNGELFGLVMRH